MLVPQSTTFSVTLKPSAKTQNNKADIDSQPEIASFSGITSMTSEFLVARMDPKMKKVPPANEGRGRAVKRAGPNASETASLATAQPDLINEGSLPKGDVFSIAGYRLAIAAAAVRIYQAGKASERYSGVAVVEVRLGGAIKGAQVALSRSSGQHEVDGHALALVRKALALVPLPDSLPDTTIELPVEFGADEAG